MRTIPVLAMLAFVFACGSGGDATGLSDERFIEVVVELRRAAAQTRADPDAFTMRRDSILEAAGVTEAQVRGYVDAHAEDLRHMATIWATINERLGETPEPR